MAGFKLFHQGAFFGEGTKGNGAFSDISDWGDWKREVVYFSLWVVYWYSDSS